LREGHTFLAFALQDLQLLMALRGRGIPCGLPVPRGPADEGLFHVEVSWVFSPRSPKTTLGLSLGTGELGRDRGGFSFKKEREF